MTQFDNLPPARGIGAEGSEFKLVVDHLAEFMHTFHMEIEGPTTLVTTYKDRRCLLTFAPMADGQLTVELRTFTEDALTKHEILPVGLSTLIVA